MTSSDWFAILNISEHGVDFLLDGYFSFYEFALNLTVSLLLTGVIVAYFRMAHLITQPTFITVMSLIGVSLVICDILARHWCLAVKRYVHRALIYTVVDEPIKVH